MTLLADQNLGFLTLGGAVCQTGCTMSRVGVPLKSLGYGGLNELCGRWVASQLSTIYFQQVDQDISFHFFGKRPLPKNIQLEFSLGVVPMESLRSQNSEYVG